MYNTAMAKKVPFSRARAELSDLLDEVELRHEHVEITRNGRPVALLVPIEEYESVIETLDILGDDELMEALRRSEDDVQAGRVKSWEDVKRDLGLA